MAIQIKVKPKAQGVGDWPIFKFGGGLKASYSPLPAVLGGKGANLVSMSNIGIPVPPGFIIPCEVSLTYHKVMKASNAFVVKLAFISAVKKRSEEGISFLTDIFGYTPLVSVRSGARVSMPGMMDTVLNVGITEETLPFWKAKIGERAALDSYRRLIQMLSSLSLGVKMSSFEYALASLKLDVGVSADSELSAEHLEELVSKYLEIVSYSAGRPFPQTLWEQLHLAIDSVFESWENDRAKAYRKDHGYSDDWGTAVTVQAMVFGNMGESSCSGVLFSRDPSTGAKVITGEYLVNSQGEDVVAGIRTPEGLAHLSDWNFPVTKKLFEIVARLETHYKDMQDIEFTVQEGELFILQTRNGKRSAKAAFEIAYQLANEGVISNKEAVGRVSQSQLLAALRPTIDQSFNTPPHLSGIAAGGGVVSGEAVFSSQDAINCTVPCILVTKETTPEDYSGMSASVGIITQLGGLTSHAAVVARGMNKTCVVGCTDLTVTGTDGRISLEGGESIVFAKGQKLTLDGATGRVWVGIDVPVISGEPSEALLAVLSWARGDGVSERVSPTYSMGLEDVVALFSKVRGDSVYVDTALLEGVSRFDDTVCLSQMALLGTALESFKGSEIVLDLTGMESYMSPSDKMLDLMLWDSSGYEEVILRAKTKVVSAIWPSSVTGRLVVKLPKNAGGADVDLLSSAGIRVMRKVVSLGDLLNANGPVEVSEEAIKTVFGSMENFEVVRLMVENHSGKSLTTNSRQARYWFELLTEKRA